MKKLKWILDAIKYHRNSRLLRELNSHDYREICDKSDQGGHTPLQTAITHRNVDVVCFLLDVYSVRVDQTQTNGNTVILLAVKSNCVPVAKAVLAHFRKHDFDQEMRVSLGAAVDTVCIEDYPDILGLLLPFLPHTQIMMGLSICATLGNLGMIQQLCDGCEPGCVVDAGAASETTDVLHAVVSGHPSRCTDLAAMKILVSTFGLSVIKERAAFLAMDRGDEDIFAFVLTTVPMRTYVDLIIYGLEHNQNCLVRMVMVKKQIPAHAFRDYFETLKEGELTLQTLVNLARYFQSCVGLVHHDLIMYQKMVSLMFDRLVTRGEDDEDQAGISEAWRHLGEARFCPSDPTLGLMCLRRSTSPQAYYHLGCFYFTGKYVGGQDVQQAVRYWNMCAKRGHAQALYRLALVHASDNHGIQNQALSQDYLKRATALGDPQAQYITGMYFSSSPQQKLSLLTQSSRTGLGAAVGLSQFFFKQIPFNDNVMVLWDQQRCDDEIPAAPGTDCRTLLSLGEAGFHWMSVASWGGKYETKLSSVRCLVSGASNGLVKNYQPMLDRLFIEAARFGKREWPEQAEKLLRFVGTMNDAQGLGIDTQRLSFFAGLLDNTQEVGRLIKDKNTLFLLAFGYFKGTGGLGVNFERGYYCLTQAAQHGHAQARELLAQDKQLGGGGVEELFYCLEKVFGGLPWDGARLARLLSTYYRRHFYYGNTYFIRRHVHNWTSDTARPRTAKEMKKHIVLFDKIKLAQCQLCQRVEEQHENFQLCGRCKSVNYCSKECQTRHWDHEFLAHRALCKFRQTSATKRVLTPLGTLQYLVGMWPHVNIPSKVLTYIRSTWSRR